jgi:MYXO-CTERM domain-containing protein
LDSLLGSYADLDGYPIIAGQYASAIPEHCGGVLLLAGGALLALRRRRMSP